MMPGQKITFFGTDVLGSVVHPPEGDVSKLTAPEECAPSVESQPISPNDLIDVGEGGRYVHRATQQLLIDLQKSGVRVVLVSGMRQSSYMKMRSHLPHSVAVIEDGCVLYNGMTIDEEWNAKLVKDMLVLHEYMQDMIAKGLVVDTAGRSASYRVDPASMEYFPDEKSTGLEKLVKAFPGLNQFPQEVRRTTHAPYPPPRGYEVFQFIPTSGGKANALEFVMYRDSLTWLNAAALGDDLNDEEMLIKACLPMTLVGAHREIQKLVVDRKGILAQGYSHNGTILALQELVTRVKAQT